MVRTNSNFVELGTTLPEAKMYDTYSGQEFILNQSNLDERNLLIMFICAHCPFVKHIENQITEITEDTQDYLQVIAISSNDIKTHPADSPANLRKQSEINGWHFPYLYDEDQSFARELKAACTPDFYLFSNLDNAIFKLFYHGQLDNSRPSNGIPVTGKDLRDAINAQQEQEIYQSRQVPSLGCNIKWTPGKEPEWFK